MTSLPTHVRPAPLKDVSLALLALPLIGVVLPFVVFSFIAGLGNGPGAGDDGDGHGWAFLGVGMTAAPIAALVAGVLVAVRTRRSGYQLLPVVAALSPFLLPATLSSGVLWR
ncbi:hypothetical protein [Streptomyces sp. CBMA123]|uniref:hypothetical protein n=1 Tax=Streptomyces sp. CBMA123 TaxID=1896313 RepID=UPI001CB7E453|nr:hypothetical protein [Streptomyces sp. CBMA123]MBD0691259.1 hypothetical protein [Streptomyces sp. CBMA123]